jgi:hypothetical protein
MEANAECSNSQATVYRINKQTAVFASFLGLQPYPCSDSARGRNLLGEAARGDMPAICDEGDLRAVRRVIYSNQNKLVSENLEAERFYERRYEF